MADRAEIERLLNQTGRTLEGLPDDYGDEKMKAWRSFRDGEFGHVKSFEMANCILHQSDVIELLVGALRDALDKPMQKPLTLEEFKKAKVVWIECSDEDVDKPIQVLTNGISDKIAHFLTDNGIRADGRIDQCGSMWRAWASRPTDEEREAAAWES